jgi:hypothetical protein
VRFSVPYVYCWACVVSERERESAALSAGSTFSSVWGRRGRSVEKTWFQRKSVCLCVCVRFFSPLRAGSADFCASLFSQETSCVGFCCWPISFCRGIRCEEERSGVDLHFPGLRIPIRRGGRLFASVNSFVIDSGVAVPWHKVKGERKGWRQVGGSKLTTVLVQNRRDSAVLLQKQT